MDDIRSMFLRQSLWDCQSVFAQSLAHTDAPAWDYLVITAANETQAAAYRAQVNARLSAGQLPRQTRYLVIPDPDGRRVGSGGATLNVMRELDRAEGGTGAFAQKRVLVLHSGGDGQRAPQYSACGKLFSRVPRAKISANFRNQVSLSAIFKGPRLYNRGNSLPVSLLPQQIGTSEAPYSKANTRLAGRAQK